MADEHLNELILLQLMLLLLLFLFPILFCNLLFLVSYLAHRNYDLLIKSNLTRQFLLRILDMIKLLCDLKFIALVLVTKYIPFEPVKHLLIENLSNIILYERCRCKSSSIHKSYFRDSHVLLFVKSCLNL
jgi:hypothetical protein